MQTLKALIAVVVLTPAATLAAVSVNPTPTVGEIVLDITSTRPRVYAEACLSVNGALRPTFDQALAEYRARVQEIGAPLLVANEFVQLAAKRAPENLANSYHQLFRRQAGINTSADCPQAFWRVMFQSDDEIREIIKEHMAFARGALIAHERGLDPTFRRRLER